MRCIIILSFLTLCACKALSKKKYVSEQRVTYLNQETKSSCVEEHINWQFISLDNIYDSDSRTVSALLKELPAPPKVEINKDTLIINGKHKILFSQHKDMTNYYFMYGTRNYAKDLHNYFIKANKEFSLNSKDSIPYLQIENYLDSENDAFDWEDYTLWQTIPCNGKDLFLVYKKEIILHYSNPQRGFYAGTDIQPKRFSIDTTDVVTQKQIKEEMLKNKYVVFHNGKQQEFTQYFRNNNDDQAYYIYPSLKPLYLILVYRSIGEFGYSQLISVKDGKIYADKQILNVFQNLEEPSKNGDYDNLDFKVLKDGTIMVTGNKKIDERTYERTRYYRVNKKGEFYELK